MPQESTSSRAAGPEPPFSGDLDDEGRSILEEARQAVEIEIAGLERVKENLGRPFVEAIRLILQTRGRVVVTGIGKSGLVGRKIASTLASTGTPAVFLHPVEAMHGDLGILTRDDVVVAISNSGETHELSALLPVFHSRRIPVIALTGNLNSTLSRASRIVLDISVEREACSLGLAPTASTTATLAVGDAIAVVLLKIRHFNELDFRRNHPGGTLGERLKIEVRQVMLTGGDIPVVRLGSSMRDVLQEMDTKGLGCVLVLDGEECLAGIVTDGDLRRALAREGDPSDKLAEQVMTRDPKRISPQVLAAEALALMERHLITVLPVVGDKGRLLGIVHLHDLLGKGQFSFTVS